MLRQPSKVVAESFAHLLMLSNNGKALIQDEIQATMVGANGEFTALC
jgi:hypothetical protein